MLQHFQYIFQSFSHIDHVFFFFLPLYNRKVGGFWIGEHFVLQLYSGKIFFSWRVDFLKTKALGMLHNGCYSSPTSFRVMIEFFSDLLCENLVRFLKGTSKNCSPQEFLILLTIHAQFLAIYQSCHWIASFTLWLQLQILVAVAVLMHLSLHRFQGRGFPCDFTFQSSRKVIDLQFVQIFF